MPFTIIANTQAASFGGSPTSITTPAIDTSGANLIIVHVSAESVIAAPVLSDNKGNVWTGLTEKTSGAAFTGTSRLYYCYAPIVGAGHTFSLAAGASASYQVMEVLAVNGAAGSPFDQENGATGTTTSTIQPGSVTPGQDNELVVTGVTHDAMGAAPSINSGFTISDAVLYDFGDHYAGAMAYLIQTSAGAVNPTWTLPGSAGAAAATIATFKFLADFDPALFPHPHPVRPYNRLKVAAF